MRVLCACVLMFGLVPCVQAEAPIYLVPQDGEVDICADSVYCAEVWIGAADDIKGFSIEVVFKPGQMTLVDVTGGDIFSSQGHGFVFYDDLRAGAVFDTVAVDASDLTGSVSGPGHLFTLCFGAPWECGAVSPLIFLSALVRDSRNQPIDVVTSDGTVTISCPTAVDVSTWGCIKALYR